MANHLLIGLGGTGGKILREYRKRYFEQYKGFEPHNKTHVDYLYVDTSAKDVEMNDWDVMGTSVKLADHQVLSAHRNPGRMLERITEFPKLNSFITSKDIAVLRSQSNDLISSGVASQRRRLGRILFTANVDDYLKAVKGRVDSLIKESGDSDVSFHICAGLAGGTGSGMIVDAIAQLHKLYSNNGTRELKIFLYLFVPEETNPDPNKEAFKFYQANGYAALLELNSWSVGAYEPIDITVGKTSSGELSRVKVLKTPFQSAYLFSDTNEKRKHLDKNTGLPQMVADYLFQKTMEADGGLNDALVMVDTSENSGFEAEKDTDTNQATHSRRFLSFGLQRVVYPEKEIKEALACEYAASAVNQMLYNDWQDGYVESSTEVYDPVIVQRANGGDYSVIALNDDILTFETPIEPNELTKHWGGKFKDYWIKLAQNIMAFVMENVDDKDSWIAAFNKRMSDAYKEGFRRNGANGGVENFFKTQKEPIALGNTAANIVRKIESHLFTEWKAGRMSMADVRAYLKILIKSLADKKTEFSQKVTLSENKIKRLLDDRREKAHNFQERGLWRAITSARKEDFSDYVKVCSETNAEETIKASYEAAIMLLPAIESRLLDLLNVVVKILSGFDNVADYLKKTNKSHELPQNGMGAEGKAYFYDKDAVDECERTTVHDKQLQDDAADRVRNSIIQGIGTEKMQTFTHLQKKFFDTNSQEVNRQLLNILLKESLVSVSLNLDEIAKANTMKSVTKVNILQKMYQELGDGDALAQFMSSLKKSAATYLEFDSTEKDSTVGLSGTNETTILCLPNWADDKENYRAKIVKSTGANDTVTNNNDGEISIVSLYSAFPLRYVSTVAALKRAYHSLLQAPDAEYNKLVMHTETFASPLPDIYNLSGVEKAQNYEASLILSMAMNLVGKGEHPEDESPVTTYKYKNDSGMVKTKFIEEVGFKNVLAYLTNESEGNNIARNLGIYIHELLETDYKTVSKKQALRDRILEILQNDILPTCKGGEIGKEYAAHESVVENILLSELR